MSHSRPHLRELLRWPLLASAVLLFCSPAQAAFLSVNGLDGRELVRHKITVALVAVRDLTVTWRTSYARSGHLELQLEEHLFGPTLPPAALKRVPYTSGVGFNSAWPELGRTPIGNLLLMAWRNGHACGEGSAVHLGERFSLPMAVSSAADARVAAVRAVLKLVNVPDEPTRLKQLEESFVESSNPYLVLFVDSALQRLDPQHRQSAQRYARLLGIINGAPGSDEELGWPLLQELTRFPNIRDREIYEAWKQDSAGPAAGGTWPSFSEFRRFLQSRFRAFARSPRADVDLRRWALAALAVPPAFVATRDRLDEKAVSAISERLRDPVVEVRRDAARTLLTVAAAVLPSDQRWARRLLAQVRRELRRETDPEERANLQIRIDEIQGSAATR